MIAQYYNYSGWVLDVTYLTPSDFMSSITSILATRECRGI